MTRKTVIYDTDPGVDDAMALAFLRAHPDVDIAAITAVFGNATVEITARNAALLAERFGIDAPVYAGAADPLVIERLPSPAFVHGHDGLGDAGVTQGFLGGPASGFAPERIVELVQARPGEISILAVGPLTNLAIALRIDPHIAALTKEVILMGGSFYVPGNVSPVAEANIRCDPHAADAVFTASWSVTAVSLDVTHKTHMPSERAHDLAQINATGQFLWDISRGYEALYKSRNAFAGCALHDAAAAVRLVRPDLFQASSGPIRVVTDGIAIGQTVQRTPLAYPPNPWDGHPDQSACTAVDAQGVVDLYVEALSRLR
jgi:inosine-uridine nucleoside N-ribohydrolase